MAYRVTIYADYEKDPFYTEKAEVSTLMEASQFIDGTIVFLSIFPVKPYRIATEILFVPDS